ncbi:MAG: amino acid ABC transporter ATP-binding protein [Alphaproteobacteria bacterium 40-19]|nr:MAG: amino acid ABC transporter ATP-binding protein [Alphaproteobacteria bacterium 40-19]
MLKINNLCKLWGQNIILNDISLSIDSSKITGLAGPSGSGKSTLLRCIQKLDQPNKGHIEFQGQTGFMFQDFQLFPHMTVLSNLTYAPSLRDPKKDWTQKALFLLQQLGLKDKRDCYPDTLSGGQKQRVALARSLMIDPDLLLCDEPTSGLDINTIQDVSKILRSLSGKGLFIASHDLDFLTSLCDRIIILREGSIVFDEELQGLKDPIDTLKQYYHSS